MAARQSSDHVPSIEQLLSQLIRIGVSSGDIIMVHASLRAVGPTTHGGDGLIEALGKAVAPAGTLLMVLGAEDNRAWVNERPEHERAALLAGADAFDANTTPAQADVGTLAELFRRYPGTVVSDHPEGRFAARGHRAVELVANQPWDDYYGPGSPLERLVMLGGKILRLGADLNTVTAIHYAEYLAPLPHKRRVRRHRLVRAQTGSRIRCVECLDDENGIAHYAGEDYFAAILRSYLETGKANVGTVGAARSELIDAADFVNHAVAWMTENLI